MGLLKGFNREVFRLKSRRIALRIFKLIFSKFAIIVYFIGLVSLGLFPSKLLHDRAVPDEKALLIGQVTRYYNYGDSFKLVLPEEIWTVDNEQRALGLQEQFELLGLDTTLQSFQLNREGEIIKGKNVHGILRAPRGEGTEAIVLSAPQYTYNGELNRNGIQLLFSFALFCKSSQSLM